MKSATREVESAVGTEFTREEYESDGASATLCLETETNCQPASAFTSGAEAGELTAKNQSNSTQAAATNATCNACEVVTEPACIGDQDELHRGQEIDAPEVELQADKGETISDPVMDEVSDCEHESERCKTLLKENVSEVTRRGPNDDIALMTTDAAVEDPGESHSMEPLEDAPSMESLEDALQMAAASIEQQAEEGHKRKRQQARDKRRLRLALAKGQTERPDEQFVKEQVVEEALAEHDPEMILDEVAPDEFPKPMRKSGKKAGKKRSPKRKRTVKRIVEGSPPAKRAKIGTKASPDNEKRPRRSKEKDAVKGKSKGSNTGSLKVKLHGQVLSKRQKQAAREVVVEAMSDHGSIGAEERDTPTPKILTANKIVENRAEPNRLHVAAIPGVYAIKKRGSWLMCGLCPFRSKQAADITKHLRQFDFYDMHCPKCQHVVTRTHRGPDNKILSCLHCDYRNGDHIIIEQHEREQQQHQLHHHSSLGLALPASRGTTVPPKEDIVAIAAKMILEDDDEEPSVISEITDESGQPIRVLSVERDLEELVRAGVVTLCRDTAQLSIRTEPADVVHIDVAEPPQTEAKHHKATVAGVKGSKLASPRKLPAILRRKRQISSKK